MNSTVVHSLGDKWPVIQHNVIQFMGNIGPEGVPLCDFEAECLSSVFLPDRPAALAALKRKKLCFPVRDGLAIRVFRHNPDQRRFSDRAPHAAGYAFARSALALMTELSATMEARDMPDSERRLREKEGVKRIIILARRHIEKGTPLAAMRGAMWAVYKPGVMALLSRHMREFDPAGEVEEVELAEPTKRLPNGLPPHERLIEMLRQAGGRGMWKSQLRMRFPSPRPKAIEIDAMLAEIQEADLIQSAWLRLRLGQPCGWRFFHSEYGLPRIINDTAYFDFVPGQD